MLGPWWWLWADIKVATAAWHPSILYSAGHHGAGDAEEDACEEAGGEAGEEAGEAGAGSGSPGSSEAQAPES